MVSTLELTKEVKLRLPLPLNLASTSKKGLKSGFVDLEY